MTMKFIKYLLATILTLGFAAGAWADQSVKDLEKTITKSMPGLVVDSLKPTPLPGIYELVSGGDVAYISGDGTYMIQGTMYNVKERKNLTDATLGLIRAKAMKSLENAALVTYPAKGEVKHTITVFTDPSCPYCHRLHEEIGKLNEMGVTVNYALYARSGGGTLTSRQLQETLCSKDPKKDVERFFQNASQNSPGADCAAAKTLETIATVAKQVNLEGTPFIVMDNGRSIAGYRPAADLFAQLEAANK